MRRAVWAAVLAGGLGLAGGVRAGLVDDGWVLGAAGLAGPDAIAAGGAGVWLEAGQARLFGLPELPTVALAGAWRPAAAWLPAVAVSWEVLDHPLYRQERRSAVLWWGAGVRLGLAGRAAIRRLGDSADPAVEATTASAAGLRLQVRGRVGAAAYLVAGRADLAGDGPAAAPPEVPAVRVAWRAPGWAVGAAGRTRAAGPPVWAVEAWGFAGGAGIGWHAEVPSGAAGVVVAWRWSGCVVRSSHVVHPQLGVTHRFVLGFGNAAAAPW